MQNQNMTAEEVEEKIKALDAEIVLQSATNKIISIEQTGVPAYFTDEEAEAVGLTEEPTFAGADLVNMAVVSILSRAADTDSENDPPQLHEEAMSDAELYRNSIAQRIGDAIWRGEVP